MGEPQSRVLPAEPIWVIFICWVSYMMDLAVPNAQWAKPELANGEYLDWQRACGWMATWCAPAPSPSRASPHPRPHPLPRPPRSPVLILFLVSMTTFGGREASVRVVPLLVANQARPPAPPPRPPPSACGRAENWAALTTPPAPPPRLLSGHVPRGAHLGHLYGAGALVVVRPRRRGRGVRLHRIGRGAPAPLHASPAVPMLRFISE